MYVVTANETCQRQNFLDDVIPPCTEFRLLYIMSFHTVGYAVALLGSTGALLGEKVKCHILETEGVLASSIWRFKLSSS